VKHNTERIKSLFGQDNHVNLVEHQESLIGEKHDREIVYMDFGIYHDSFAVDTKIHRYYAKSDRMTRTSGSLGINLTPENVPLLLAVRELITEAIKLAHDNVGGQDEDK